MRIEKAMGLSWNGGSPNDRHGDWPIIYAAIIFILLLLLLLLLCGDDNGADVDLNLLRHQKGIESCTSAFLQMSIPPCALTGSIGTEDFLQV